MDQKKQVSKSQISRALLTREEAAAYLGVSRETLDNWASEDRYHLDYIKIGRVVRYRVQDLEEFIKNHIVKSRNQ